MNRCFNYLPFCVLCTASRLQSFLILHCLKQCLQNNSLSLGHYIPELLVCTIWVILWTLKVLIFLRGFSRIFCTTINWDGFLFYLLIYYYYFKVVCYCGICYECLLWMTTKYIHTVHTLLYAILAYMLGVLFVGSDRIDKIDTGHTQLKPMQMFHG